MKISGILLAVFVIFSTAAVPSPAQTKTPAYPPEPFPWLSIKIPPSLALGAELYLEGKFAPALTEITIRALKPDADPLAYYLMGRLAFLQQSWDDATAWFTKAKNAVPDSALYQYFLARSMGERIRNVAPIAALGRIPAFRVAADRAVAMDPGNLDARQVLLVFHLYAPGIVGGNRAEAMRQIQAILSRNESYGLRMSAIGEEIGGSSQKAEAYLRQAVSLFPDDPYNYGGLARWLVAHKRGAEALDFLEQAQKRIPSPLMFWYLGKTSLDSGLRIDEGLRWFMTYIDLPWTDDTPTHADAWLSIGKIYEKKGQRLDEKAAFRNAVNLLPGFVPALDALSKLGA